MNTPSSRRQFVKKSALFAGAAVSLPRLSSLAAETNAPATAAPPPAATNAPAEPLKPRTGLRLPEMSVHDPWPIYFCQSFILDGTIYKHKVVKNEH